MTKFLSIVLLMAFTLSGFAVAAPYSPVQGEVLDDTDIGSGSGDVSPDWDFLRPAPPETRQSPTAEGQYLIAKVTNCKVSTCKVSDNADIKGWAKTEVGWQGDIKGV